MNNNGKTALCGMATSISVSLMFLTGILPALTYTLPAFAGAILIILVIELGSKWAFMSYISVSILSIFLAADKEAALIFIAFFGYYPILKNSIEKMKNKFLRVLLKLLVFNFSIAIFIFLTIKLISFPKDITELINMPIYWVMLVFINFIFILYDYVLSGFIIKYNKTIKNTVNKILHR